MKFNYWTCKKLNSQTKFPSIKNFLYFYLIKTNFKSLVLLPFGSVFWLYSQIGWSFKGRFSALRNLSQFSITRKSNIDSLKINNCLSARTAPISRCGWKGQRDKERVQWASGYSRDNSLTKITPIKIKICLPNRF